MVRVLMARALGMRSDELAKGTLTRLQEIAATIEPGAGKGVALLGILEQLMETVHREDPCETIPRNLVMRTLKVVREEIRSGRVNSVEHDMGNVVTAFLSEVENEVDVSKDTCSREALKYVVDREVVLTIGHSRTVEHFLSKAKVVKPHLSVLVVENGPFFSGHSLAENLIKKNIATTLIPDGAVFTVMSRVTKVIIGCHSVTGNGGIKAVTGSYGVALAAKHHSVPLYVLVPTYKYSAAYFKSHVQMDFNRFLSPDPLMPINSRFLVNEVDVLNPVYDYVPPELITNLVTGLGEGTSPRDVHHKLATLYDRSDYMTSLVI